MLTFEEIQAELKPTSVDTTKFTKDVTTTPLPWLGQARRPNIFVEERMKDGYVVRIERDPVTGCLIERTLRSLHQHGMGAVCD